MAGGADTSANFLAWSAYVFATQHKVQEKLRDEILELVARNSQPTHADIDNLPYLNGFVKETLRVYSPGK
jgi:cytochrome P450